MVFFPRALPRLIVTFNVLSALGLTLGFGLGLTLGLATRSARAEDVRTSPVLELGSIFYSGKDDVSLTGSKGYAMVFKSEATRGMLRAFVAAQFDYSAGNTSVGSTASGYTLYGGSFLPGHNLFMFKEGFLQPFLGLNGALGWNFMHLKTPPSGVDAYTQGFAYGYEVSAGVDLRRKRADGGALRLRCSIWNYSARVAGQAGFGLNGYRLSLGYVF